MNLEREQIQTLNKSLNDVYNGYRRISECLNDVARNRFNFETYTIEISEKQKQEMSDSILDELTKIERAVQKMKNLLETLDTKN